MLEIFFVIEYKGRLDKNDLNCNSYYIVYFIQTICVNITSIIINFHVNLLRYEGEETTKGERELTLLSLA